jgi:acyl-coenzyme A thioesterase PaaI-like protein
MWREAVGRDRIHPGCLCALADTTCGFAVGTSYGFREGLAENEVGAFATLDLRMDYVRSADPGKDIFCQASCHRLSRSVAFVKGELRQPGADVVALVNATFMRSSPNPCPGGPGDPLAHLNRLPAWDPLSSEDFRLAFPEGLSPYMGFLGVVRRPRMTGEPVFCLPFSEDFIGNPRLPALHGGVLAGFGETAMILHLLESKATIAEAIPEAVDFTVDYLRPAKPMDTYAEAATIRLGNRVSLVQANLWQEDPQRPVAAVRGHLLMAQA